MKAVIRGRIEKEPERHEPHVFEVARIEPDHERPLECVYVGHVYLPPEMFEKGTQLYLFGKYRGAQFSVTRIEPIPGMEREKR